MDEQKQGVYVPAEEYERCKKRLALIPDLAEALTTIDNAIWKGGYDEARQIINNILAKVREAQK